MTLTYLEVSCMKTYIYTAIFTLSLVKPLPDIFIDLKWENFKLFLESNVVYHSLRILNRKIRVTCSA